MNPLFPDEPENENRDAGYVLPRSHNRIERDGSHTDSHANPAVELIRNKIDALYADEPSARQEAAEVKQMHAHRSKHQQFMYEQTTSGKSLAEIQTAWHNYYAHLNDQEKREVWQEFYSANAATRAAQSTPQPQPVPAHQMALPSLPQMHVAHHTQQHPAELLAPVHPMQAMPAPEHTEKPKAEHRTVASIKKRVLSRAKASHNAQVKAKQHLQSLAFGLGIGALVIVIFLFGLFNEMVIAPFIKPSSLAEATPIILNADSIAPGDTPELIIPKINVELPIIYGSQSSEEKDVQKALEEGVFHYPTTATPGQNGNAAFFGHSSNNIFNKGKYKFAFVLLHELEPGDIFYLTYNKQVYTYKVYSKKIVNPDETWVLNNVDGKAATVALITCDPPGTTLHRLVVWGEQISPDANGNTVAASPSEALQTQELPDNGPTLWSRFYHWVTPW